MYKRQKQPCPQPVINIMGVVGDIIGDGGGLRLCAGETCEFKALNGVLLAHGQRNTALFIAFQRLARGVFERAIVFDEAFQGCLLYTSRCV